MREERDDGGKLDEERQHILHQVVRNIEHMKTEHYHNNCTLVLWSCACWALHVPA
jgi:hypothetical protein